MRQDDKGVSFPGVVRLNKELAIGTIRSAIRQAGISVDKFVATYEGK
jgi:hypothetical protein